MALLRTSLIVGLLCIVASDAHALKGTGGGGGAGFSCSGLYCNCDGSYTDCKDMESSCHKGKIECHETKEGVKYCSCLKKVDTQKPTAPPTKVQPKVQPGGAETAPAVKIPLPQIQEAPQ